MRDLTGAPAEEVAAERARVATEGTGARLLALQGDDGRWGGAAWNHGWNSTMHILMLLRDMGLNPASDQARRAVGLVRDRVTWQGCGPQECDNNPFFAGEVEPCINGQVGTVGAYFGQDIRGIVDRLLGEQLTDGGWNCESTNGSTRSSFNTTICVLEVLLEHELRVGSSPKVTRPVSAGRSTSSSTASSVGSRLARSSTTTRRMALVMGAATPRGPASPSRRGGTTMCCGGSSTCAAPASRPTSVWPRRSNWSRPSAMATAGGRSRSGTPARCRSRSTRARVGRAGGTHYAPYSVGLVFRTRLTQTSCP